MGVDKNFSLVKIYNFTVKHDLQGDSTHITGCSVNFQGEFSMVSINIKMLDHFGNIGKKVNLTESQCAEQPLPQASRKDTTWETETAAIVACFPCFVPLYFRQKDIDGDDHDTKVKD